MAHLYTKIETIRKGDLQPMLPKSDAISVTSTAVGQNKQSIGCRILNRADLLPPIADGCHGEFSGIAACAQIHEPLVAKKVVYAVRNGDSLGIGGKIVVQHRSRLLTPATFRLMKRTDKFTTFSIHTDYRQPFSRIIVDLGA